VAGGGTAGHVQPGIEIARALVARGHPAESIHFVGSTRGIEARLVPAAGFGLTVLPGRGIVRRLSVDNVAAAAGLGRAAAQALALVRRLQPAVVVALGGYASVPCALAAVALGVPLVVVEQNAVPGAANRLVARFARASAVSFPDTALPRAEVTGNPVRPEILAVDRRTGRAPARGGLGLPVDRSVVGVFGGSLGARRINLAVVDAVSAWRDRTDLAVRHVVGERDWELVADAVPALPLDGLVYQRVRYEEHMALLMTAVDLLVGRAGGTTVAEVAAVGLPAVLVPLPIAPGDHQTANARALERAGAAIVVPDAELDGPRLVAEVEGLLSDRSRLDGMAAAAAACARRDAAERVAALVERHARG
jgi:UDP-N-acetylglucosamine--N-acetylmuramyl-(pentapeptide) pyrophosphoryl-undecaprenol N-acetylglucosamine transferase